jgi:hypothetical protein
MLDNKSIDLQSMGTLQSIDSLNIKNIFSILKYIQNTSKLRKSNSKSYYSILSINKKITKILSSIRRLKLRLNLNKYKFEDKLLFRLSQLISKYYGKKVEFNIINVKSLAYNTDIFTQVLTSKLRQSKSSPVKRMKSLLARVVIPKVNTILERGRVEKQVDHRLAENKYKNININNIITGRKLGTSDNLNKLLQSLYNETVIKSSKSNENLNHTNNDKDSESLTYYLKLRNIILNNIKYKTLGGARLVVKGRLTRRYRADRALYKFT